ncbi:MAG TPA: thioesterase family protein [Stellaceae bacterium]|nr:thioesterase family protein [Stellaceae bacterium]
MQAEPLPSYRSRVLPEWIDYNGHMNLAYYLVVFDKATDALFDRLGIGLDYVRATEHSLFALEAHVTYARELKEGDPISIASRLVDADEKRLHFFHEMQHADEGYLAATIEFLAIHVAMGTRRAVPFPDEASARIGAMLAEHRRLPQPPQLGRSIGLRNKRANK